MKTDKELADELDARDRLRSRGYTFETCSCCKGMRNRYCSACLGRGGFWRSPDYRHIMDAGKKERRLTQPRAWTDFLEMKKTNRPTGDEG